jgi:dolichol kinase
MTAPHPARHDLLQDRPANLARNVLHFSSGLTALLVIQLAPSRAWVIGVASVLLVVAWTIEWTRRRDGRWNDTLMRVMAPVAHSHERHHINSATWYTTALFLIAIFGDMMAASLAVMVLGAADPVAAQVGRRFGRHHITRNRTVEGTAGFVVAGVLVSAATLAICYPALDAAETWGFALVAALAGAVAELVSQRVDDNLSIPLVTTAVVMGTVLAM